MNDSPTISDLESLKQSLLEKVALIDKTIVLYRSMSQSGITETTLTDEIKPSNFNVEATKYGSYKATNSFRQKFANVLSVENRFLTIKQIADIIQSLEPELDYKIIKNAVSSAKAHLLKERVIVKYTVGKSNTNSFYGGKNWLDENGQPKLDHMYDEEALLTSSKEQIEI